MLTIVVRGQALAQQLVDVPLARFVERRSRLVEEEPVRPMQQRARDGEALLLAAGERQAPVALFVEAVGEIVEADGAQRVA